MTLIYVAWLRKATTNLSRTADLRGGYFNLKPVEQKAELPTAGVVFGKPSRLNPKMTAVPMEQNTDEHKKVYVSRNLGLSHSNLCPRHLVSKTHYISIRHDCLFCPRDFIIHHCTVFPCLVPCWKVQGWSTPTQSIRTVATQGIDLKKKDEPFPIS